ncbi:hypothetical protein CBI31_08495 [Polynucleobacter campilacus]|uniref:Uncharacterized protein n=1 Tax=Polynucleobacter campilacus TaxID=1743163 RepID=A0A254Q118_9BURK|nr:hypothetical protein CBI31_08495 [Polynucleobacter campilacus]
MRRSHSIEELDTSKYFILYFMINVVLIFDLVQAIPWKMVSSQSGYDLKEEKGPDLVQING